MVLAQKQPDGSMEQNRAPRNKPKHLSNFIFDKGSEDILWELKTVSLTNGVGKVEGLHISQ